MPSDVQVMLITSTCAATVWCLITLARRCCDWSSTYSCASLLRLKSIVGCSRNTRLGKFSSFQCVWKHIANSTLQSKYPNLERGQFLVV